MPNPQHNSTIKEPREGLDRGASVSDTQVCEFNNKKQAHPQALGDGHCHQNNTPNSITTLPSPSRTQSLQWSNATNEAASSTGCAGEGSLLCSPLPSPFSRNYIESKSPANEPISIYQGLVRPVVNPPRLLKVGQKNMGKESKSKILHTGNNTECGNKETASCWFPKRLRRLLVIHGKKKSLRKTEPEEASGSGRADKFSRPATEERTADGAPQPED